MAQASESFPKFNLFQMMYQVMEKVAELGGELRCGAECLNVPLGPIIMARLQPVIHPHGTAGRRAVTTTPLHYTDPELSLHIDI